MEPGGNHSLFLEMRTPKKEEHAVTRVRHDLYTGDLGIARRTGIGDSAGIHSHGLQGEISTLEDQRIPGPLHACGDLISGKATWNEDLIRKGSLVEGA